jgi:hypothetical protein
VSEISLQYEVGKVDHISFYRKVSSEPGDVLRFKINNQVVGEWSGTTGGWIRESFPVQQGMMTFTWEYDKNGGSSGGADCSWIDYIIFPQPKVTTLFAGIDDKTCQDEDYFLNGQATAYDDLLWETSGTGLFSSMSTLSPVYTPSESDIESGQVNISLIVWGTDGHEYQDDMVLTIEDVPEAPEMPNGPDYVDLSETYVTDYTIDPVEQADAYQWMIDPPEAGTFSNRGTIGTVVWDRNFAGDATIYSAVTNSCGEGEMSPGLLVTVENNLVKVNENPADLSGVHVYPNPNNGRFSIYLDQAGTAELGMRLVNLTGQTVWHKSVSLPGGKILTLDHSYLKPGIYFLVIQGENVFETSKVIIN